MKTKKLLTIFTSLLLLGWVSCCVISCGPDLKTNNENNGNNGNNGNDNKKEEKEDVEILIKYDSEGEPIKAIDLGNYAIAENHSIGEFAKNIYILAKGKENTPISFSLKDDTNNVFKLSKTEIKGKENRDKTQGALTISIAPPTAQNYTAVLLVTYSKTTIEVPISISIERGPADELINPTEKNDKNLSVDFLGQKVYDGASIKIKTATLDFKEGGVVNIPVKINFPTSGYSIQLSAEKDIDYSWCLGGLCEANVSEKNNLEEGEQMLGLHFEKKSLPVGTKNKITLKIIPPNSANYFTLFIVFDIQK